MKWPWSKRACRKWIALAAGHEQHGDGPSAASAIFSALGIENVQERESSNFVEGRYFLADVGDVELEVSYGESDEPDLPIWLMFNGPEESVDSFVMRAADALRGSGFRVARLENFGKHDEVRVDL